MTTFIAIIDTYQESADYFEGADLGAAAKAAYIDREGETEAIQVTPMGGTHYHVIYRGVSKQDDEKFWLAMLSHSMNDNEDYGWGESPQEALADTVQELDE